MRRLTFSTPGDLAPDSSEDLWVIARAKDGNVSGGLKGRTFYSWLFIDWLWVSSLARGQGIGGHLLARAEGAACERGRVRLRGTFSFQAPGYCGYMTAAKTVA